MRIGLLTTSFPREDGDVPGTFVLGFARALVARGHSVEALAPEPCENRFRQPPPRWPGIELHWVRYLPRQLERTFYGAGVLDNLAQDPRAWLGPLPFTLSLARAAQQRAKHWDAVVSHWALPCALIAGRARRVHRPPLPHLAILHSADVHLVEKLPGSVLLAQQIARSASALVFASRDLRTRFLSKLGPLERVDAGGRSHVSAMGIDLPANEGGERDALRRDLGLSRLTLLSLGRLVPIKGVDLLLRAIANMLEVELVIAGDGPERARLEAQARASQPRVRFVGEVRGAEKARWLRAADVFVLSSRQLPTGRTEGTPNSVIEAMAAGLPVIASATGGLSDLITHDENGLLVAPSDVAALQQAVTKLLEPTQRARLAHAALDSARAYAWPVLAPHFEALLAGDDPC